MAEDIKMNVFPQVTNAEYIYGELVDGSQVKINKNELACLIGAVIYSSSISDLNAKTFHPNQDKHKVVSFSIYIGI